MRFAVDPSVLLDEHLGDDEVVQALAHIRWRLKDPDMIVSPSAIEDLEWQRQNTTGESKRAATGVLCNLLDRGYTPMNFIPAGHGVVEQIAFRFRRAGCLPDENETDSLILAEAALIGCGVLLTSTEALLASADHCDFAEVLDYCDVPTERLLIATPQNFVRRFYPAKKI